MKRTNGSGMKRKGDVFEREVAEYLSLRLYGDEETVRRAPLSGGGSVNMRAGGSDLIGLPSLFVEAKRTERLAIHQAMKQAITNAGLRKTTDYPIVVSRRNREATGDSKVVLRLDDFADLYRDALRHRGLLKE